MAAQHYPFASGAGRTILHLPLIGQYCEDFVVFVLNVTSLYTFTGRFITLQNTMLELSKGGLARNSGDLKWDCEKQWWNL